MKRLNKALTPLPTSPSNKPSGSNHPQFTSKKKKASVLCVLLFFVGVFCGQHFNLQINKKEKKHDSKSVINHIPADHVTVQLMQWNNLCVSALIRP